MTHENGKNIGGGTEFASPDEQKIAGMLSSLKRVEAPKDFDFHLKARIANTRPENLRPVGLFPILKYALPLALFLFSGAGIMLYSSFNGGIDQSKVQVPEPATPNLISSATPEPTVKTPADTTAAQTERVGVSVQKRVSNPPGHVEDSPLTAGTKSTNQRGSKDFMPSRPVPPSNSADLTVRESDPAITPVKRFSAGKALELIGIEADFEDGSWRVKSVRSNEIAGHMGVRPGDRLKAIDGNPIDEKTEFKDGVKINNSIQVVRGNDTILLTVKKPDDR